MKFGTKLILIAVLFETLSIAGGVFLTYTFLSAQKKERYTQILSAGVSLIAKEIELQQNAAPHFHITDLPRDESLAFQILDQSGEVLWDSFQKNRVGMTSQTPSAFANLVRHAKEPAGTLLYHANNGEEFLGEYRRVQERYLILGATSKDEIEFGIQQTVERFLYFALFLYGLSFVITVFFTRYLLMPVRALTQAAQTVASGSFEIELKPSSNDEIGALSATFAHMISTIRLLVEESQQKGRIVEEVDTVASIQEKLLPASSILSEAFDISSYYQAATETGGDYWGYIETEEGLTIYVADATGHGLPSAMLTAATRGCFSAIQEIYKLGTFLSPDPSQFLAYANQAVYDVGKGELQMTMFVAFVSFREKTITYANAGHQAAYLLSIAPHEKITALRGQGPRLGESPNFESPPSQMIPYHPQDCVFLYTDGLLDIGKPKLKDLLGAIDFEQPSLTTAAIAKSLQEHFQGEKPSDDVTFAMVRLKS